MMNTIYCRTCGKELSSEAIMCPNCGTPIKTESFKPKTHEEKYTTTASETGSKETGLSVVAFIFALIAFVTGIIFGAFFYVFPYSQFLLFSIGTTTILPALTGIAIGTYLLCAARNKLTGSAKTFSVISIVFASIAILFLFLTGCIISSGELYY